jgi:VIT1/CCC1 family predicted Fe2+/Mn2+ transporter
MAFFRSRKRFLERHLDPADRLEEAFCGLIMVLDFTLIAGLAADFDKKGMRDLLLAALGCNMAWGLIDGSLYVMRNLTARRRRQRFLLDLRNAPTEEEAFSAIGDKLDPLLEPATNADEREGIFHRVLPVMLRIQMPEARIIKADVYGMLSIFLIDAALVIPAVIPFLFFTQPRVALRVSNAVLIALLFATGLLWGRYTGVNGYLAGSYAMLLGLVLVGIAIALGG